MGPFQTIFCAVTVILQLQIEMCREKKPSDCQLKTDFQCSNRKCVSKQLVCNGRADCPNGEDESHYCKEIKERATTVRTSEASRDSKGKELKSNSQKEVTNPKQDEIITVTMSSTTTKPPTTTTSTKATATTLYSTTETIDQTTKRKDNENKSDVRGSAGKRRVISTTIAENGTVRIIRHRIRRPIKSGDVRNKNNKPAQIVQH